jgi:hypothetical protein
MCVTLREIVMMVVGLGFSCARYRRGVGSVGFSPPGAIQLERLVQAVAPDDGCLPNGRVEQVDLADWWRAAQACGHPGWSSSWRGWSDEAGDLTGDGWPGLDLIESARAQCLQLLIPPRVQINVWPAWGWQTLWFDFDVREMTDQRAASALGHFVYELAAATGRQVLLSYEGADGAVFARYDSATDHVTWI